MISSLRTIDAHHHLWDPAVRAYPWMSGEALAPLRRRYSLTDLRAVTEPVGVDATVVVQAVGTLEETVALLAAAATSGGLIVGVVGWVDLTAPDVDDVIEELRASPGGGALVGVRHQAQDEPDDHWLLREDVQRGLAAVGRAGLAYDLLVTSRQLPAAVACVQRRAEVRFVLDHGAKPPIATGQLEVWEAGLRNLARLPNVTCKVSGLVTEARWQDWTTVEVLGAAEILLDAFGPQRLMAASDWPVCELAASYATVWDLARSLVAPLNAEEGAAVLGGTAAQSYLLG